MRDDVDENGELTVDRMLREGLALAELDQEQVAAFTMHTKERYQIVDTHVVVPLRLSGRYNATSKMFNPFLYEVLCQTCEQFEVYRADEIDEISDPLTGEIFTLEQIVARLPVRKLQCGS